MLEEKKKQAAEFIKETRTCTAETAFHYVDGYSLTIKEQSELLKEIEMTLDEVNFK